MLITRRTLRTTATAAAAGAALSSGAEANLESASTPEEAKSRSTPHRRIATEEAFTTPALAGAYKAPPRTKPRQQNPPLVADASRRSRSLSNRVKQEHDQKRAPALLRSVHQGVRGE